jgi:hypothetical protein
MATTPKLGLTLPAKTDLMSLGDDVLSANYTLIDTYMGANVQTTAPALTFPGNLWHNTTSGNKNVANGAAFQAVNGNTWQEGFSAYDLDGTSRSTNSEISLITENFNVINGAQYLVRYQAFMKWSDTYNPGSAFRLRFKANGAYIHTRSFNFLGGNSKSLGQDIVSFFEYIPAFTGALALEMRFDGSNGLGGSYPPALINAGNAETTLSVDNWGN